MEGGNFLGNENLVDNLNHYIHIAFVVCDCSQQLRLLPPNPYDYLSIYLLIIFFARLNSYEEDFMASKDSND